MTSGPMVTTTRRDDATARRHGTVALLLVAAAAAAAAGVTNVIFVSRFLVDPTDRPAIVFDLEVLRNPLCLLLGAGMVIAVRPAWRSWGPALLVGVAGEGLFGLASWFRVWNGHTPSDRRLIVVVVSLTVAAQVGALALARAARPGAPDPRHQDAWSRPALLIALQVLAVIAVLPDAIDDYRTLSDPSPFLDADTTPWPAFAVVALALLTAASVWWLDRPHAALYVLARMVMTWFGPTISSVVAYGELELVGGAGPIARNVGAFAALAAVALVRDSRHWPNLVPTGSGAMSPGPA